MEEKVIEIRSLTGESITIAIEPSKTIQELKLLLKQKFHLASTFPNFHLFFKGAKLRLQSQISNCALGVGDFLVVVPFTKKDREQTQNIDEPMASSTITNDMSASQLAESSWSNLMQYLSSERNDSSNSNQPNNEPNLLNLGKGDKKNGKTSGERSSEVKYKIGSNGNIKESQSNDLVMRILQSASNSILEEENCKRFIQVLQSITCLSNSYSGNCIVLDATIQDSEMGSRTSENGSCLCPYQGSSFVYRL